MARSEGVMVVPTLERFLHVGVLNRRGIFGMVFYRLTEDPAMREALDQYWTWREVWRSHWQETQHALKL